MGNYSFRIGQDDGGHPVKIDLPTLVGTRGLICANSGGGKSWLLRLIAERAANRVQTLILDPEGEYATLRDKLDIALVGRDGEIAVDVRTADKLARKLVEANVSAVIDLYDLDSLDAKREYVRIFLQALMSLPRRMWHPMLLIIDEAHKFAAEGAKSESVAAVVNVMDSGRKRGIGTLLATQRISKTNKDALAEAKNVFIGNTVLDLDQERAGDILGLHKQDRLKLRELDPGTFYAFGPALGKGLHLFRSDMVATRHPKPGEAHLVEVPKASGHIAHIVEQMGDLPAQVQQEQDALETAKRESVTLRARVAGLERELKARPTQVQAAEPEVRIVERPVLNGQLPRLEAILDRLPAATEALSLAIQPLVDVLAPIGPTVREVRDLMRTVQNAPAPVWTRPSPRAVMPVRSSPPAVRSEVQSGGALAVGERKVLTAAAQYPEGVTREQLTILTGYKRSSRDTYLQRLSARGLVQVDGGRVLATAEGVSELGHAFEPLPVGGELREYWLGRLTGGEKAILEVLVSAYPHAVERDTLSERTGYKRSSRDTYLQRLLARRLVVAERGLVRASDELF